MIEETICIFFLSLMTAFALCAVGIVGMFIYILIDYLKNRKK